MQVPFKISDYDPELKELKVKLFESLSVDHLKTMYSGDLTNVTGKLLLQDPRRFTEQQRALYRALLSDINKWSGLGQEELHDFFKGEYVVKYEDMISTANDSNNSIDEVNQLIEIVIEFMFTWNVPFKRGYELLPRDQQYYYYQCCKHRKCVVCGKSHADIHHLRAVGNRNRKKVDHRKFPLTAVCREHHNMAHNMGVDVFMERFQIHPVYLNGDELIRIGIMNRRQIMEFDEIGG